MAKTIKITRLINLVEGKLAFKFSKEVRAAMAAVAVNIPDPFNAGCKDAKIKTGMT
jgi:hypothetical protein